MRVLTRDLTWHLCNEILTSVTANLPDHRRCVEGQGAGGQESAALTTWAPTAAVTVSSTGLCRNWRLPLSTKDRWTSCQASQAWLLWTSPCNPGWPLNCSLGPGEPGSKAAGPLAVRRPRDGAPCPGPRAAGWEHWPHAGAVTGLSRVVQSSQKDVDPGAGPTALLGLHWPSPAAQQPATSLEAIGF